MKTYLSRIQQITAFGSSRNGQEEFQTELGMIHKLSYSLVKTFEVSEGLY